MKAPRLRPLAALAALGLAVSALACSDDDGGGGGRGTGTGAEACGPGPAVGASGALDPEPARFRALDEDEDDGTVTADAGGLRLSVELDPLRLVATSGERTLVRQVDRGGLRIEDAGGAVATVTRATTTEVAPCAVRLGVDFDDGRDATLTLQATADDTVAVTLAPGDPEGVARWGVSLVTPPGERIYGLTTRIVDDQTASEIAPAEAGSLDRKGETVTMEVRPTISGYVPFHQSSAGYGLLVDGTMPGVYDIGRSDPEVLALDFELDPSAGAARWFLFAGPGHGDLNDAFSRLTGRPPLPPEVVFGHTRGRDELPPGPPVEVDGVAMNPTVADDLLSYERYGIPPGIYHFDRPWAEGSEGFGALRFDPNRFPDAEGMLRVMRDRGWRVQVWFSEWALDQRGAEAEREGWLASDSPREIDLTDPEAVTWLRDDVVEFLRGPEGRLVDGFFLDRTDEIVPSDASDVYADGRNGRQVHNAYPVLMQDVLHDAVEAERGNGGWVIARAAYTGTPARAMSWGGDTRSREGIIIPETPDTGPSTDLGLRSVLISVQRAAFMGLVHWGSDIGGYSEFADREVFARWLEVGAVSPLMRVHGKGTKAPWDMPTEPRFDAEVLDIYRRYVLFHHALAPYLHGLAEEAARTGMPLARPLVYEFPGDPRAGDLWDEWLLGPDLLVAPVWRSGARQRDVYLPAGRWVDLWDRTRVIDGPADLRGEPVPLDRLPMFVRPGSPVLDLPVP